MRISIEGGLEFDPGAKPVPKHPDTPEHRPNAGYSKWHPSKAAGSSATEAYSFFTRPPRAARTAPSPGVRCRRRATENDVREKARLGAQGLGG